MTLVASLTTYYSLTYNWRPSLLGAFDPFSNVTGGLGEGHVPTSSSDAHNDLLIHTTNFQKVGDSNLKFLLKLIIWNNKRWFPLTSFCRMFPQRRNGKSNKSFLFHLVVLESRECEIKVVLNQIFQLERFVYIFPYL